MSTTHLLTDIQIVLAGGRIDLEIGIPALSGTLAIPITPTSAVRLIEALEEALALIAKQEKSDD